MHILQGAFGIILRTNAQILLHLRVPGFRKIIDTEITGKKRLLQFITDNNMQIVGHLIRFDANQGGANCVDREMEVFELRTGKCLGECSPGLREEEFSELPAASDLIFPETGLGFVNTQRDRFSELGSEVLTGQSLFIKSVTCFVDRAE